MIYHHGDTANTHIHIVSTRVDKQGQKVDDAFEKIRSQKVMQEILSLDPAYEAKTTMEKAMVYRFSTDAQFGLLLERQGYIPREKEGKIEIIRYGVVQGSVDKAAVQEKIREFSIDENRCDQQKAWLLKYTAGKSMNEGIKLMREKFGVELVYHQTKGHENPYGYTLIDHKDKTLYKGSQILGIREFFWQENMTVDDILQKATQNNWPVKELEKVLKENGWKFHRNGTIQSGSEKQQLSAEFINALHYQERRQLANSFSINDPSCKVVLADWLGLKKDDIHPSFIDQNESEAHRAVLAYLDQTKKWEEGLLHFQYALLRHDNQIFLLSATEPALMNTDKLMVRTLSYPEDRILMVGNKEEEHFDLHTARGFGTNTLQAFLQILADSQRNTTNDQQKRKSLKR